MYPVLDLQQAVQLSLNSLHTLALLLCLSLRQSMTMAGHTHTHAAAPALSEMVVGIDRSARAKAAIASDFLPGVRAACSSTTCAQRRAPC